MCSYKVLLYCPAQLQTHGMETYLQQQQHPFLVSWPAIRGSSSAVAQTLNNIQRALHHRFFACSCCCCFWPEKNYYLFRVVGLVCSLHYATYTFPSCLCSAAAASPLCLSLLVDHATRSALTFITLHGPTRDKMILLAIVGRCRRRVVPEKRFEDLCGLAAQQNNYTLVEEQLNPEPGKAWEWNTFRLANPTSTWNGPKRRRIRRGEFPILTQLF